MKNERDQYAVRAWNTKTKCYTPDVQYEYATPYGHLATFVGAVLFEGGYEEYKLEQSTGLRDIEDNLIYKNDILQSNITGKLYTVQREKHFATFSYRHGTTGMMLSDYDIENYKLKVVGNINENKNLLDLI